MRLSLFMRRLVQKKFAPEAVYGLYGGRGSFPGLTDIGNSPGLLSLHGKARRGKREGFVERCRLWQMGCFAGIRQCDALRFHSILLLFIMVYVGTRQQTDGKYVGIV